ncbi:hypothetical protein ACIOGZ_16710 [Kitasatospora sp. NPDC088160]|uniref:hypothetical protein n=1 Tax=Kitasatospora sp. NPDC088160 TaxID=3364072 RepID=UPI0037F68A28
MTTPAEIVTAAAGAFVGAMSTDVWQLAKDRISQFVSRHGTPDDHAVLARLDGIHQDLLETPDAERESAARAFTRSVARDLQPLVFRSAEAESDLRRLVEALGSDPRFSASGVVINSGLKFSGIKTGGGDFNFTGRDRITGGQA